MKRRNILIYQYSSDHISEVRKRIGLDKKIGSKVKEISHNKAIIVTSKPKRQLRKIIEKVNKKYNTRLRVG